MDMPESDVVWIYRNDRKYDVLKQSTHAVVQICRSYSESMPKDTWSIRDMNGEIFYEIGPKIYVPKANT